MAIAVVHDPSEVGRAALTAAFEDADLRGTNVVILHTLSGSQTGQHDDAEGAAVRAAVEAAVPVDRSDTWSIELLRPQSDAVAAITDRLEVGDITRLVIGSRRRTAVGKLLLGRDVQRLLLECPLDVLLVKLDR